jgi:hypothetical protein
MTAFLNIVTIARPPDEVFAFLADFGNIPAWNYAIARIVQTSPGPARVGATYRQTRTVPRRSEEAFQLAAAAPASRRACTPDPACLPAPEDRPPVTHLASHPSSYPCGQARE